MFRHASTLLTSWLPTAAVCCVVACTDRDPRPQFAPTGDLTHAHGATDAAVAVAIDASVEQDAAAGRDPSRIMTLVPANGAHDTAKFLIDPYEATIVSGAAQSVA